MDFHFTEAEESYRRQAREWILGNIPPAWNRDEHLDFAEDFDDYNGICLACGEIQYGGVEPDARAYPCESCGARS